jgi:hypothetical protein
MYCMVKIINCVSSHYRDAKCLDIGVLNGKSYKSYYLVKRSKQWNIKDMFIGYGWGSMRSWKPLGFNRCVLYG